MYAQITPMSALPLQTILLTHSDALMNPSNRILKLNGPFIFDLQKRQIF